MNLRMTEEIMFHGTSWSFERSDGSVIKPVITLRPNGVIGNYSSPSERGWKIRGDSLAFVDEARVPTTIFEHVDTNNDGTVSLSGKSLERPEVTHILVRRALPSSADLGYQTMLTNPTLIARPLGSTGRRFLVILRANQQSLHNDWTKNIPEMDRSWDFCISWYGRDAPPANTPCEYLSHQAEDRKFAALYALLTTYPELRDYDGFWLPDDDILTSWRDINLMFEIFQTYQLDLAQPSLVPKCFVNHEVTRQIPASFLRFVDFIEVMCPLFSQAALIACLPTFNSAISGWGLDFVWPQLLGRIATRIAVIDHVGVAHTRLSGGSYDHVEANTEMHRLLSMYGVNTNVNVRGGISLAELF